MANENSISSDLIRGHIDTIILRSLYDGDKHGNDICLDIEDKSGGQYEIKQPTLYSALKRLETTGLVDAYWSSGVGGRRRYFRLTDEGKKVCEDNFNLWIVSRNIIDKLISDGGDLGYPVYQQTKPVEMPASFEEDEEVAPAPKFNPADYENYSFAPTPPIEIEEDFDFPFVSDSIETEAKDNSPVLKTVDDTDPETKILAEENETNLNNLSDDSSVFQLSLIEIKDEETEEIEKEEDTLEENVEEPIEEPSISDAENEDVIFDGNDDSLVIEPYSSLEKEYSDILSQLYPIEYSYTPVAPAPVEVPTATEEVEEDDEIPTSEIPAREKVVNESIAVTIDLPKEEPEPNEVELKPGEIDYRDILTLAKLQGFRVKTSDKTNRAVKGKLFISRLVALSASLLFIIMLVEMAVICYPLRDVLNFSLPQYGILVGTLFAFPLVSYLFLIFTYKKTVDKLPTLKYCITASIVGVLNLVLLTFALALLMQVDLYNAGNILKYIIIPFVIYLNIPIYFIIKYLIVSKGWLYAKK